MITVTPDFNLKAFNTFGMDVTAAEWIEYDRPADLPALYAALAKRPRFMAIGEGSNLLFTSDYPGAIVRSRDLSVDITPAGQGLWEVTAGAGVSLDELAADMCSKSLWGLENLSGIPGTAGAAAVQNVGAYGVEFKDVAVRVAVCDFQTGRRFTLAAAECGYAYRDSMFKHHPGRYFIESVTMLLSSTPRPHIAYGGLREALADTPLTPDAVRQAVISVREQKLPAPCSAGSAGSFFKNPEVSADIYAGVAAIAAAGSLGDVPHFPLPDGRVKIPAAWLIDACSLKGRRVGGAAVWQKQPLVIVNLTGQATAADVMTLAAEITDTVERRFGITLSREVQYI